MNKQKVMKNKLTYKYFVSILILFSFTACDWFAIQDTDDIGLYNFNKLIEIIDADGNSVSLNSDNDIPLFIYRTGSLSTTLPQQYIDSLFYIKTQDGELIDKWEIKELISYSKRKNRSNYLLSNGKYIYFECDKDLVFKVSEQVDSEKQLKGDLKTGRYTYLADKPNNW